MVELEGSAKASRWYRTKKTGQTGGNTKYRNSPGKAIDEQVARAAKLPGDKQAEMDRLP